MNKGILAIGLAVLMVAAMVPASLADGHLPNREERQNARERFENVNDEIRGIRAKHIAVVEEWKEHRDVFTTRYAEYKECVETGEVSERCDESLELWQEYAKDFFTKSVELMNAHMDNGEEYLNAHAGAEFADDVVADMNVVRADLDETQAAIDGLSDDATKEEVLAVKEMLLENWRDMKQIKRDTIGVGLHWRASNIHDGFERLEAGFSEERDALAADGEDVSDLDVMLDDFSATLDESRESYMELTGLDDETFREKARLAKTYFGDLRDQAKDIRDEVRRLKLVVGGPVAGVQAVEAE